jgi:uncharacterized membrane protein YhaH (DUF805 family)
MFPLIQALVYIVLYLPFIATREPALITPYAVAAFLPALAIFVRRLRDIGRSGRRCFFGLVPRSAPSCR